MILEYDSMEAIKQVTSSIRFHPMHKTLIGYRVLGTFSSRMGVTGQINLS